MNDPKQVKYFLTLLSPGFHELLLLKEQLGLKFLKSHCLYWIRSFDKINAIKLNQIMFMNDQ